MAALSDQALSKADFSSRLDVLIPSLVDETAIAVASSGGGDSTALSWLLADWTGRNQVSLHVLTVDHGLRKEAAKEARQVSRLTSSWGDHITARTLKWTGPKPKTRVQEEARGARYRLMAAYCQQKGIQYLFLAHHQDDQAETILFRLAKGSGVDGLAGMGAVQRYDDRLSLVRPLLDVSHQSLILTCKKAKLDWFEDVSNVSDRYARARIRKSAEALAAEGLTNERLAKFAGRMERIRRALCQHTEEAWKRSVITEETKRIVFVLERVMDEEEEIILRLLGKGLKLIGKSRRYPPALETLEKVAAGVSDPDSAFRAATLAGCVIRRSKSRNTLTIEREAQKSAV